MLNKYNKYINIPGAWYANASWAPVAPGIPRPFSCSVTSCTIHVAAAILVILMEATLYLLVEESKKGKRKNIPCLVMCQLWPEARSQARPGQKNPGQAGPDLWPEMAFGLAWILSKPEPAAWAAAWKANSKIVGDVLKLSLNYYFWYCTVKNFF